MRIDLFLRVSGLLRTRTLAGLACDGGFVKLCGRPAKPSARVSPGDVIDLVLPDGREIRAVVDIVPATRQVSRVDRGRLYHLTGEDAGDHPV